MKDLKAGDCVVIRSDISETKEYKGNSVESGMLDYAGTTQFIQDIDHRTLGHRLANIPYGWTNDMLRDTPKVGDTVRLREDLNEDEDYDGLTLLHVMAKNRGHTGEVISVNSSAGNVEIKGFGNFTYSLEMLEDDVVIDPPRCEPAESPDVHAILVVSIKDVHDNVYETHCFHRHAESSAESEKLFWSMLDRYAKDSFFSGMMVIITLRIDGIVKMDITASPTKG